MEDNITVQATTDEIETTSALDNAPATTPAKSAAVIANLTRPNRNRLSFQSEPLWADKGYWAHVLKSNKRHYIKHDNQGACGFAWLMNKIKRCDLPVSDDNIDNCKSCLRNLNLERELAKNPANWPK